MEQVEIKTIDGISLAGTLFSRNAKKSALLLHTMPGTKEDFETVADELYTMGLNVLAIDFRGHGESEGKNYKEQTDEDIEKYFMDARAALNFLEEKYQHSNFVVAGGSIGANVTLQCLAHDHAIKKGVALSPGLNYHGLKGKEFAEELSKDQEVLFVASQDDDRNKNAVKDLEEIFKAAKSKKQKAIYKTAGHGTHMWDQNPELIDNIVDFLVD